MPLGTLTSCYWASRVSTVPVEISQKLLTSASGWLPFENRWLIKMSDTSRGENWPAVEEVVGQSNTCWLRSLFKPHIEPVKAVQKAMEFRIYFFVINSLFLPFWLNVIYPHPHPTPTPRLCLSSVNLDLPTWSCQCWMYLVGHCTVILASILFVLA